METIIKNPGLQHVTEDILMALDRKSLKKCKKLNLLSQYINQPNFLLKFWLKKLSQEDFFKDHIEAFKQLIAKLQNNYDLMIAMANMLEGMCILAKINRRKNWNSQFFDRNSGSPLHLAIALIKFKEDLPLVKFILENVDPTCYVKYRDRYFKQQTWKLTSVHIAALFGLTEIVQKLTQNMENPNVSNVDGITPMQLAARNGNLGAVQFLLNSTLQDVHSPNVYGYSPIHYATEMGHTEVVYELVMDLVKESQNPNPPNVVDSNTPLHYTVINYTQLNHINIIKFLIPLTNGNHNVTNNQGFTPAELASRKGKAYLQYLLDPQGNRFYNNPRLFYCVFIIINFLCIYSCYIYPIASGCYQIFLSIDQWIGFIFAFCFGLFLHFLLMFFAHKDKILPFQGFFFCSIIVNIIWDIYFNFNFSDNICDLKGFFERFNFEPFFHF